jgi:hypothetical protein
MLRHERTLPVIDLHDRNRGENDLCCGLILQGLYLTSDRDLERVVHARTNFSDAKKSAYMDVAHFIHCQRAVPYC